MVPPAVAFEKCFDQFKCFSKEKLELNLFAWFILILDGMWCYVMVKD